MYRSANIYNDHKRFSVDTTTLVRINKKNMVTITDKGILIEIPGNSFGVDDIEIMQDELIEALEISTSAKGKTCNYHWLFQLLKAIVPNREQLEKLYPDRGSG